MPSGGSGLSVPVPDRHVYRYPLQARHSSPSPVPGRHGRSGAAETDRPRPGPRSRRRLRDTFFAVCPAGVGGKRRAAAGPRLAGSGSHQLPAGGRSVAASFSALPNDAPGTVNYISGDGRPPSPGKQARPGPARLSLAWSWASLPSGQTQLCRQAVGGVFERGGGTVAPVNCDLPREGTAEHGRARRGRPDGTERDGTGRMERD